MEDTVSERGAKRQRVDVAQQAEQTNAPRAGVAGLQSCDSCRTQKVKCDAPRASDSETTAADYCSRCKNHKFPCTYKYRPKKRGPPALTYDKLLSKMSVDQEPYSAMSSTIMPVVQPAELIYAYDTEQSAHTTDMQQYGGPGPSTIASRAQLQPAHSGPPEAMNGSSRPLSDLLNQSPFSFEMGTSPDVVFTETEIARLSYSPMDPSPLDPSPRSIHTQICNPLDTILPRGLLHHVVDLFFDYVYGLVPCLHRTSFMGDLYARREERPEQEEWTILVLMIVAATLCHLPRHLIPIPRADVRRLVERCFEKRGEFIAKPHTTISVTRIIILYLTVLVAYSIDLEVVGAAAYGASYRLSIEFKFHLESGYAGHDPIETEMRRRVFWLLYGSDKTDAVASGIPLCWHEDDCADVQLPSQIDDEYFTKDGYLSTAGARTPVLAGFYYISKLFRLTGQIIEMKRMDLRRVPCGIGLQMRLNEVDQLIGQVMTLMDGCPPELRLQLEPESSMESTFVEWDALASDIEALFFNVTQHRTSPKYVFLVQQANIYITQQMIRYYVLQYRDDLLALRAKEVEASFRIEPVVEPWRPPFTSKVAREAMSQPENEKDSVASDMLAVLRAIPLEVIAVNGTSLVAKVRFVASTLLDSLIEDSATGTSGAELPESTRRAHEILGKFLSILGEIEALYSWADTPRS